MRLTDITVRSLASPAKGQKIYFDDTLQGFGCRVSQAGTRSFVLQYGDDRRLSTIGKYPIITLGDARAEAKRILAEHVLGKRRVTNIRWDDAVKAYLEECAKKNRPRTHEAYDRLLNRHFDFASHRLAEISYKDIEHRLRRRTGCRRHPLPLYGRRGQ